MLPKINYPDYHPEPEEITEGGGRSHTCRGIEIKNV